MCLNEQDIVTLNVTKERRSSTLCFFSFVFFRERTRKRKKRNRRGKTKTGTETKNEKGIERKTEIETGTGTETRTENENVREKEKEKGSVSVRKGNVEKKTVNATIVTVIVIEIVIVRRRVKKSGSLNVTEKRNVNMTKMKSWIDDSEREDNGRKMPLTRRLVNFFTSVFMNLNIAQFFNLNGLND